MIFEYHARVTVDKCELAGHKTRSEYFQYLSKESTSSSDRVQLIGNSVGKWKSVLTLTIGESLDGIESSTSTSVSVSTVTRKVTSRSSFSRSYQLPNDSQIVTEDLLKIQEATKSAGGESVSKPQKIKKKILASNLKNVSEKVVFPSEKYEKILTKSVANVTEAVEGGKPNTSDSSEDEMFEEVSVKSENTTETPKNRTLHEGAKRKEGPVEGRSLEDRSSEENINVNAKSKSKILSSTTVRTTNAYSYETFGELQKVLNNNYLNNNEGYEQGGSPRHPRPSSVILPARKTSPISKDNSFKNAIRFESEYYESGGQTDWVPIIPDELPPGSPTSRAPHFGSKLKSPVVEKLNKTKEKNSIVFPSDGVQPVKVTSTIPVREVEFEKTTPPARSSVQTGISTGSDNERVSTVYPVRHVTKFRGAVRYKPAESNSTVDYKKFQNGTSPKKNISLEIPAMDIPVTGASWTLATLEDSEKSTAKPFREETTEISIVSSTNHTTKSQNAVDSGVAVPPENIKVENVTKEPQMKNVVSSTSLDDLKHNKSEIANSLPKVIDGGQGWIPINIKKDVETKNYTDLTVPKSVLPNQRNDSELMKHTTTSEIETNSGDVTTEEASVTESTSELTTLPKLWNATTEKVLAFNVSSQSSSSESLEIPMTTTVAKDEMSDTTVDVVTGTFERASTPPPETTVLTTLNSTSVKYNDAGDVGTSTEVFLTTVTNLAQDHNTNKAELGSVSFSTQQTNSLGTTETTQTTSLAISTKDVYATSTASTFDVTLPKHYSKEKVTKTTLSHETPNTKPNVTQTTPTMPATMGTTPPTSSMPPPTTTWTVTTSGAPPPTERPISVTSTTRIKNEESRTAVTEEGIYYKNYIPTTINPHDEITEENVPAYLRLTVQAKDWEELCRLKEVLREAIIKMLGGKNISAESVHFLNINDRNCQEKIKETKGGAHNGTMFLPVNMFLMDKNGDFDKNLSEAFLTLWGRRGLDFELPIRKVDFVTPIVNLTELADPSLGGSVVAAIVISCVAGICVILLGVLFVVMKRRQKRFNYGQRCTPVSLDAYSLDSVSIYNSVRRKGVRVSKRSYGNAAFDDPETPTHPMNFAGLANFSADKEQLYEEFNIIPQVYPKVEELPTGAETKNRYANIIPLPETRVHLSVKDGDPLSDYINANYVRGLKGAEKLYIACQAPMESTIEDFWRMVWEQQCKVILMLTDLQENGIEKCADYLPPNEVTDNLRLFGDFQVTLKKRDVKEKYIISNLKLKNMEANLWREVTHLWYLGWPEQGVPSEANSLIAFLIEARSQTKIQNGANTASPVVVHCSPGTGRTGTVIACDLCIREYEQSRMVDIPRCVFNLRRDRAGAVQTKDQYAFIYQVLNVYATKLSGGGIESI